MPLRTLRVDIDPLARIFDIRWRVRYDVCYANTRYAHCVSADLYHIKLERSESISNLPQGKYIEPSEATAYRQLNNRICDHKCSACKEKRTESVKTFSVLFLSVGTISIESKTVLNDTPHFSSRFFNAENIRINDLFIVLFCFVTIRIYYLQYHNI